MLCISTDLSFSVWIICSLAVKSVAFADIPSNPRPFPGTTRKLHPYLMLLLIIAIHHMPILWHAGIIVGMQHFFHLWICLIYQY